MASAAKTDVELRPGEISLNTWNTSHIFLRIYGVLYLTSERLIYVERQFGRIKRLTIPLDDVIRCSMRRWPIGGVSIRRRDGSKVGLSILSFWGGADREAIADINAVLQKRHEDHG